MACAWCGQRKARTLPVKPCASDLRGVRCLEDYVNTECPIETITEQQITPQQAYDGLKTEINDLCDMLKKETELLKEVEAEENSPSASQKARKIEQLLSDTLKSQTKLKLDLETILKYRTDGSGGAAKEAYILTEKAFICSGILETLNKSPNLKRLKAYSRLIHDKDVVENIQTPMHIKLAYIAFPCFVFFIAFGVQSFLLHITTHFYVYYMEEGSDERREGGGQLLDLVGNFVGQFLAQTNPEGQGAVIEGSVPIPLFLLDASGVLPFVLCVTMYTLALFHEHFNIGLWNKTFLVAAIMAVLKGLFDVVTIMPDSIGWDSCEDRLGRHGLREMRKYNWLGNFWGSLWRGLIEEIYGGSNFRRVRYCADMMVSGHTYSATLFALSAYKQVAFITDIIPERTTSRIPVNKIVRRSIAVLCILCILTEVCLVAAARFHYTVDMLAAIVLVLILWDSATVEQIAADWSEGFHWRCNTTWAGKPFYESFWDDQDRIKKADVLPSQSTCVNQRVTMGYAPWSDPGDIVGRTGALWAKDTGTDAMDDDVVIQPKSKSASQVKKLADSDLEAVGESSSSMAPLISEGKNGKA